VLVTYAGLGATSPHPSPSEDKAGLEEQLQQTPRFQENTNQHHQHQHQHQHQQPSNLHQYQQQAQHILQHQQQPVVQVTTDMSLE
jgi:hypothetical protein